jgi:hypothetical protein
MIKEIFGESFYITQIEHSKHEEIQAALMKSIPEDNHKSWKLCNVKSTFFEKKFLYNINSDYKEIFMDEIIKQLKNINGSIEYIIEDVWYNIYNKNDYQEPHHHIGIYSNTPTLSCIYCLKKSDAQLYFLNPSYIQQKLSGIDCVFAENDNYKEHYYPNIEEGTIIIFPSYLYHGVSPQKKSDDQRITIVCNIRIVRKY